jgi:hypothetical protein
MSATPKRRPSFRNDAMGLILFEAETTLLNSHKDRFTLLHLAPKKGFGQRILEMPFHGPAQRASSVLDIIPLSDEKIPGPIRDDQRNIVIGKAKGNFIQFQIDDL